MTESAMPCPVCRVPLVMSERQGVEIDYCPKCRGVWLDRGELDKIIERAASEAAPAAPRSADPRPQPGYDSGYGRGHDPHYGRHKRKKSFLEELFD
jgi:Zn-finger nucleic acid-binding protein